MTTSGQASGPLWANSTSRSLLADVRRDAPSAWVRLVNLYAPLVAAWCRRGGVPEQDIGDVLQDVFSAVAGGLDRFRKDQPHDTFRGWLAVIARNKVRDYYRGRADRPAAVGGTEANLRLAQVFDPVGSTEDLEPEEAAAFSDVLRRALDAIRGEFHEHTWQAFWGVVVDGKSTADIAAALHMQPGAVRVAKSRVLMRLRRELGDTRG
jgi:RNA polymerase sigma-70 factor (ECF subfamily)